jgi:hypothetical protein
MENCDTARTFGRLIEHGEAAKWLEISRAAALGKIRACPMALRKPMASRSSLTAPVRVEACCFPGCSALAVGLFCKRHRKDLATLSGGTAETELVTRRAPAGLVIDLRGFRQRRNRW